MHEFIKFFTNFSPEGLYTYLIGTWHLVMLHHLYLTWGRRIVLFIENAKHSKDVKKGAVIFRCRNKLSWLYVMNAMVHG